MSRKIVLLTSGDPLSGPNKTAINLLRYRPQEISAVLNPASAGQTCQAVFGLGGDIPVISSLDQTPNADTLLLAIAPAGGKLPAAMRTQVLQALQRKMKVVSGLHDFLQNDPEIAQTARQHGVQLHDVRKNDHREVAHRQGIRPGCLRIHTVGHDCNVGKMLVSLELSQALKADGHDAKFVATGQTGIMIEGDGCPVDAVVVDFVNGAAEQLVLANQHHDILVIEGQGSLVHPRYSAVTLGLLHGCIPDALILCYEMGRTTVSGMDHIPIPALPVLKQLYETMANVMHPCQVIAVAINTCRFSDAEAARECHQVRQQLGLPACDVLRHGPQELVEAVLKLQPQLLPGK